MGEAWSKAGQGTVVLNVGPIQQGVSADTGRRGRLCRAEELAGGALLGTQTGLGDKHKRGTRAAQAVQRSTECGEPAVEDSWGNVSEY